jgi:hypothetical protein
MGPETPLHRTPEWIRPHPTAMGRARARRASHRKQETCKQSPCGTQNSSDSNPLADWQCPYLRPVWGIKLFLGGFSQVIHRGAFSAARGAQSNNRPYTRQEKSPTLFPAFAEKTLDHPSGETREMETNSLPFPRSSFPSQAGRIPSAKNSSRDPRCVRQGGRPQPASRQAVS